MTTAGDNKRDITDSLVEIWRSTGLVGITYSKVAAASGFSKGAVQNRYPKSVDLVNAAAEAVLSEGGSVGMKKVLAREANLNDIALCEAACWLARGAVTDG